MVVHDAAGEADAAEAVARRIVAIAPGTSSGEFRLLDVLLQRDPNAAIARVEALLPRATPGATQRMLTGFLGVAQDRAGRMTDAVATWSGLRADEAGERLPLWQPGAAVDAWPPAGVAAADAPAVGLLWGAPGSGVERVAAVLGTDVPGFLADRLGPRPPHDPLQRFDTIAGLGDAHAVPDLVAQWRAGLAERAAGSGQVVDWLLFWDNRLLLALRPHLPEGVLLVALRDPRDMLLEWLAFGALAPPLAMPPPLAAAGWLAAVLGQVATLHEQNLYPHRLLRLDAVLDEPNALAALVGSALGVTLTPAPSPGDRRLPAGHWREHAASLGDAFALLMPVAQRLGYQ